MSEGGKAAFNAGATFGNHLEIDAGSSGMIDFGDLTGGYGRLYADSGGTYIGSKSNHNLILRTNNVERVRIDTAGTLMIGKTADTQTDAGHVIFGSGAGYSTRNSFTWLHNRLSTDGEILRFQKDGSTVGSIFSSGGIQMGIGDGNTALLFGDNIDAILPWTTANSGRDNAIDLGRTATRFHTGYFSNGTSSSSDQNEKQDIAELTATELAVSKRLAKTFRTYRRIDAVEAKGNDARTHTGTIAQQVHGAFAAEGLDAAKYGMYMSDTWKDDDDKEITRLGIRYEQLLSFISAGADQRLTDIEARLTALEG